MEEAERGFFSWFGIESYGEVKVQAQLRAAMGMCPAHLRRLVEEVGRSNVMNAVAGEALAGARDALRGALRPGPCPACDALAVAGEHSQHLVEGALGDPATVAVYRRHDGLCLPHFLGAIRLLEPATLKIVAERLLITLSVNDGVDLEALAGVDPDTPRRGDRRERLTEHRAQGTTLEDLCDRLSVDACPVCAPTGLIDRRYIEWFVSESRARGDSPAADAGEMCSVHLHDLVLHDGAEALGAVERKRAARADELQQLLDSLAQPSAAPRRGRRVGGDDLDRARKRLLAARTCPACQAHAGVEGSQLELVSTGLALAEVRDRYERGHGLCVRHALRVPADRAAHAAKRHGDARVRVLAWEVAEATRKEAWAYRHEPGGPERDAWLRALVQIDGRVLCGGPARSEQDERRPEGGP
ncbi:MAG: hypothetical protein ACLP50_07915 [Solirubrobacteraceae bacterium]